MDYLASHLNALAATLGLPALTLEAQGLRSIALDQQHIIHLQADARAQEVVLYGVAGQLPPHGTGVAETLLRANRFWRGTGGATLSLDGNAPPRVILARRLSPVALTPAQFSDAFTGFVDQLHHWADELNAAAPRQAARDGTLCLMAGLG